jgi:hypothetical protein
MLLMHVLDMPLKTCLRPTSSSCVFGLRVLHINGVHRCAGTKYEVLGEGHLQLHGLEEAGTRTREQRDTARRWLQFLSEVLLDAFAVAVQAATIRRSLGEGPGTLSSKVRPGSCGVDRATPSALFRRVTAAG